MKQKTLKKHFLILPFRGYCLIQAARTFTFLLYMLNRKEVPASLINHKQTRRFARLMMASIQADQVEAKLTVLDGEK